MRDAGGFIATQLLLVLAGGSLLYALGLTGRRTLGLTGRRPLGLLAAVGPAYLSGVALVMCVLIAFLVVGIPVNLVVFVVLSLAGSVALVWLGRRGSDGPFRASAQRGAGGRAAVESAPFENARWELWLGGVLGLALAAYFVVGGFAWPGAPVIVDNVGFWAPKALALFHYDHLQSDVFLGVYPHQDYPILQPLLQAITYRAMARDAVDFIQVETWLLYAAFVWTVAFLFARRARVASWLPIVAVLAVLPGAFATIELGYADVTVSVFLAAGALALGMWIQERRPPELILAAILLAAAANTKNEGFAGVVALALGAGLVVLTGPSRPSLRTLLPGLGAGLALIVPWRAWVTLKGADTDDFLPLSETLRPDFLLDRLDRLGLGARAIVDQLADQGTWIWLVPAALALFGLCIVHGRGRRLAIYYLTAALVMFLALDWVYWTSDQDVVFHLQTSVGRAVTDIVFVMGIGLAHLTASLLAPAERRDGA